MLNKIFQKFDWARLWSNASGMVIREKTALQDESGSYIDRLIVLF